MKKKRSVFVFCFVSALFFLSGCQPASKPSFDCIPTDTFFSYPIDQWTADKPTPTLVPPEKNGWVLQSEDPQLASYGQMIARDSDQIWLLGPNLQLYTKSNKQITRYDLEWNGKKGVPYSLFLARDNTLWAVWTLPEETMTILSRYNDTSDRFEPVIDKGRLLVMNSLSGGRMAEDSKGHIWIIIPGTGLFVFDPLSLEAKKIDSSVLDSNLILGSIATDANDDIWLNNFENFQITAIYRYSPKDNTVTTLFLPENSNNISGSILIDREDRLWIGDYAYWDIGAKIPAEGYSGLHLIVRPTVFITERVPFNDYYWVRAGLLFEDTYGGIWFKGGTLVRLDPETGEWCKVFDAYTSAAQDNEGVFWAVSDGKIYSHD